MKTKKNILPITYNNFIEGSICIDDYKLAELKNCCRENKLHVTGNKSVLKGRINELFEKIKSSILIQKHFRKNIVKNWLKSKGPAFKNRKICNNTTDFITLENVEEIPIENFVSFSDSKKFVYGFDIVSLITSITIHNKCKNPYTRDKYSKNRIERIKKAFSLSYILFANFRKENEKLQLKKNNSNPDVLRRLNNSIIRPQNHLRLNINNYEYRPRLNPNGFNNREELIPIWNRINNIRTTTVPERIENLFMEIDLLGNYTQASWFSQLTYNQYVRFYRYLQDIWNFRSNMSHQTKMNICPFYNPFDSIFPHGAEVNLDVLRLGCLILFENFVYCGINEDFRKIGSMHALSALTLVSQEARMSLPWLYESVRFI